ncbi:bifunctional protein fold 2 [Quercus suber]|uniref:methenyltetrahydrofolate cyclohydrolase n=1 Tax=Quercus suber TaxID=58331 RepID=A0AAW0IQ81_QUESU
MASPSDHKANIIDGKAIAQTIRNEIAAEVHQLAQKHGKVPGLAVVIVGNRKDSQSYVNMKRKACAEVGIKSFDIDLPEQVSEAELIAKVDELNANPDVHGWSVFNVPGLAVVIVGNRKDSQSYVNMKRKACAEVGIKSFDIDLPEQVSEAELIAKVDELNANPDVHGILVQLPLPKHINEENVLTEISIEKDGCLELLSRSGITVKGKKAVVEACKVAGWITPVPGGVGPMTVAMLLKNTLDGAKRKQSCDLGGHLLS